MRTAGIGLVALLVVPLAPAAAPPPGPADGVYAVTEEGKGRRMKRPDGAEVVLGERLGTGFGKPRLLSLDNDNTRFVLEMTGAGPVRGAAQQSARLAVVVGGTCVGVFSHSERRADGSMDLYCQIMGADAARRVAARLKVAPTLRKHPGHRYSVRWTPLKKEYQAGEAVQLKMEIRNTGDREFAFRQGGQQRGRRDNQFSFRAHLLVGTGQEVPDTGDPTCFGGIATLRSLKPGESFTATVPLDRWFRFADPGTYRVRGGYELELYKPGGFFERAIWDEKAEGECLVRVVAKNR